MDDTRTFDICDAARELAVVIVTYNSGPVLGGLLDSLSDGLAGCKRRRVIVADNASSDNSVEIAKAHPIGATIVEMGRNAGYAAAINRAAAILGPDADMLVLNPDIRLIGGAASRLSNWLNDPSIGVAVPQMLSEDGKLAPSIRREPSLTTVWAEAILGGRLAARLGVGERVDDPDLYRRGGPVEWSTGAALMVSARARRRVGEWDESFFLYSEETDYLRRVRQCGLSVEYVPAAKVIHIGGEYRSSPALSGLLTANRIRDYGRRHGVLATALFRLALVVGGAIRSHLGPPYRASLRAALSPLHPPEAPARRFTAGN